MTLVRTLWHAQKAALAGVILCAFFVGALTFLMGLVYGSLGLAAAFAWAGFAYTLIIGGILALVIGAPVYSILKHRGAITVPRLFIVAAIPGLVVAFFDLNLGTCVTVAGVLIALMMHWYVQRRSNEA